MRAKKTVWTEERDKTMRKIYADTTNAELAKIFDTTKKAVQTRACRLGLRKSAAFMKEKSAATQFRKGQIPHNKGKKESEYLTPEQIARSGKSRFKKGHTPHNHRDVGYESVHIDGYKYIKFCDAKGNTNMRYKTKHTWIWEQYHGRKVPKGYIVVFKDGDITNLSIDNLELISRSENLRRNSHSAPLELRKTWQLKGALRRQINRTTKQINRTKEEETK